MLLACVLAAVVSTEATVCAETLIGPNTQATDGEEGSVDSANTERTEQRPRVLTAIINSALARKAIYDGKKEEAVKRLRTAIDIYSRLPPSVPALKSAVLDYYTLYYLTGEKNALDKATKMLDDAMAANPSDAGLLCDIADTIVEGSVQNIIGDAIDLQLLKMRAKIDLLPFLYAEQSERAPYLKRVRSDTGIAKAVEYYKKALVLAPERAETYGDLAAIYKATRDVETLRDLLKKLEPAKLNVSDDILRTRSYYEKTNEQVFRRLAELDLAHWEAVLPGAEKKGGVTLAVASTKLVEKMIHAATFDLPVDTDRMITIAERSYATAPSDPTNSILVGALCLRGGQTLAEQEPAYAEIVARCERSVGHAYMLATIVSRGDKLSDAVTANPDIQRVVALMLEEQDKYPDECGAFNWIMLRPTEPEAAKELSDVLVGNEVYKAMLEIRVRLSPASGIVALRSSFAAQMAGDNAAAQEILRRCAKNGVPLPFDDEL